MTSAGWITGVLASSRCRHRPGRGLSRADHATSLIWGTRRFGTLVGRATGMRRRNASSAGDQLCATPVPRVPRVPLRRLVSRIGLPSRAASSQPATKSPQSSPPTTQMAMGILRAFARGRAEIPGDVSVVGFRRCSRGRVPDGAVDHGRHRRRRSGAAHPCRATRA